MDTFDFISRTEFKSAKYPGVVIKIRKPSIGVRMGFLRRLEEAQGDLEWRRALRALWNELVIDYNITIDRKKPTVDEFFLNGDEELVDEICSELRRISTPLGTDDDPDQKLIEDCRRQIREAEERIARRKNSAPQSSGSTPGADTRTAESVSSTQPKPGESAPSATVADTPASTGPSTVSDASGDPGATA